MAWSAAVWILMGRMPSAQSMKSFPVARAPSRSPWRRRKTPGENDLYHRLEVYTPNDTASADALHLLSNQVADRQKAEAIHAEAAQYPDR
ncbi:hypothetical protein [Streptomyces sp. NPDC008001]|uniref:hypothetical protein n=1 Tax=Streptomyces sp. NPDC008001 TaxID=3364804 RepID=UPI0036F04D9B